MGGGARRGWEELRWNCWACWKELERDDVDTVDLDFAVQETALMPLFPHSISKLYEMAFVSSGLSNL